MNYYIGTSGYSYKEWKGSFYPEKFSDKRMLGYYSERFTSVEINDTFRQIPSPTTIARWAAQVSVTFRFRLVDPTTEVARILRTNSKGA